MEANSIASFATLEHMQDVKDFLDNVKHPKLVLGVNKGSPPDTEDALKERFGEHYHDYVFSNISQLNPSDPQTLVFDFNNLEQLTILAHEMPSIFDQIILDDSTFKHIKWTPEHLNAFKRMLKPQGKFIFGPTASVTIISTARNISREEFERFIKENNEVGGNTMITSYIRPLHFPVKEGDRGEEVESLMAIYRNQDSNEDNKKVQLTHKWQEIFGRAIRPPRNILNMEEVEFRNFVTKEVQSAYFDKDFLITTLLPENYQRITEEAFGKGNVQIEFNKPLPFKSNHSETQEVLITAIRED